MEIHQKLFVFENALKIQTVGKQTSVLTIIKLSLGPRRTNVALQTGLVRLGNEQMGLVVHETRVHGRMNEADGQSGRYPAQQREQEDHFGLAPAFADLGPEGGSHELNERFQAEQNADLHRGHA